MIKVNFYHVLNNENLSYVPLKIIMFMKKLSWVIFFACCTMALAAQDVISVNYRGAKPTISDFAWAYVQAVDNIEECGDKPSNAIMYAMERQREGLPLKDGETFVVDEKNGYICYECAYDNVMYRMEMCYWNEADGKHKLFAFNNMASLVDGKPLIGETTVLNFYRYDNAIHSVYLSFMFNIN